MQRIVTILDTVLTVNYNDRPISTQKDLDTYKFQFDDSWLGYVKTAVFYTDPAMVKHLLIPEDGVVTIPWEILTGKPRVLYVGVFGTKDTKVKPTTFGAVRLREGSYIDGIAPLPPTPDVYQQIISAWEGAKADETVRVENENSRKNSFDAIVLEYNTLKATLEQEITDGTASVDALQVLEADYAAKALILESEYATDLTGVKSQLAETQNQFDVAVGAIANDAEVVLARKDKYGNIYDVVGNRVLQIEGNAFQRTKNLWNMAMNVVGEIADGSGKIIVSAGGWRSGYLPVKPSLVHSVMASGAKRAFSVREYDTNKIFVKISTVTDGSFTTGATTYFVIVMMANNTSYANDDTRMMIEGSAYIPFVPYYQINSSLLVYPDGQPIIGTKTRSVGYNNIDKELIERLQMLNYISHDTSDLNLFDYALYTENLFISTAGVTTASTTYGKSEYIPVTESTVYYAYENTGSAFARATAQYIAFYDVNKTFISGVSAVSNFTAPSGCAYIIVCPRKAYASTYMLLKTSAIPSEYYPYLVGNGAYVLSNNKFVLGNSSNLLMDTLGDSITYLARWQPTVAKKLNLASYVNNGIGGTTLADVKADSFVNRVVNVSVDADIVTIFGGTNDFMSSVPIGNLIAMGSTFDTTKFIGALQYIIEYLLTNRPLSKIVLITPYQQDYLTSVSASSNGLLDDRGYYENTLGLSLEDYANAIKTVGEWYGIGIVDLYHISGISKLNLINYADDLLHVNATGGVLIGNVIAKTIEKYI